MPTMADEAVILDKIGTIFLGGPPLVKVINMYKLLLLDSNIFLLLGPVS